MNSQSPSPTTARVLCVGDMTVDIFAQPMPRLPEPGELLVTERMAFFPGGNALNIAVALQRLGERTAFFGCVGDDSFGDLLCLELKNLGLDLRGVSRVRGGSTPTTIIYRAQNEDRRYISALGAADRFTGENVPEELIPHRGVVLAAGYYKLHAWNDAALEALFLEARRHSSAVVLNVCVPREGGMDANRCLRLLPLVDVFVPNEDEARILTGEPETAGQARALRAAGARAVVITRGSQGLYADDEETMLEMGAFSVPVVDPSGCGDCFAAGLIAGMLRGWEFPRTLTFASALGALSATALGCTGAVPPLAEVERFVREHPISMSVQSRSGRKEL